MKKFDFPLIADVLFYSASAWLILVGTFRWFRIPTYTYIYCCSRSRSAQSCYFFLSARHRRCALGKKERETRDKLMLHLALERDERVRAALLEALTADGREAHCEKDAISLEGTPLIPIFTMQPVSADAVALLLKEYGTQPFTVACNALSPEAEKLLASFSQDPQ